MNLALLAALLAVPATPTAGQTDLVSAVRLHSLGFKLEAPRGNACVRVPEFPNGPLACTRACYEGHPTPARLPVDPSGLIRLRTAFAASSVIARPLGGVADCGAGLDPGEEDLAAEPGNSSTAWRLKLRSPLQPADAVQVLVTYTAGPLKSDLPHSYYARISTRYGELAMRGKAEPSARTIRAENRLGTVLVRRAEANRPLRLVTRLAVGRYRLTAGSQCERAIRIRAGQRLRVTC